MLAVAHQLGLIARLAAVFAAVPAVLAVFGHSTIALRMSAFGWVRHGNLLT
jgi:hypothetical protein